MRLPSFVKRHRVVAVLSLVGVLAVGGAAWGYFTSHGSGAGSATNGAMSPVVLQAVAGSPTSPLYPGDQNGDLRLTVENPNSFPVTLESVALKGGGTISADGGHPTCTTTGVTFAGWTGSDAITVVNGATQTFDLANTTSMSTASLNGCQGATFSIPVTITAETP